SVRESNGVRLGAAESIFLVGEGQRGLFPLVVLDGQLPHRRETQTEPKRTHPVGTRPADPSPRRDQPTLASDRVIWQRAPGKLRTAPPQRVRIPQGCLTFGALFFGARGTTELAFGAEAWSNRRS